MPRILIVEDDAAIRRFMGATAKRAGVEFSALENGIGAAQEILSGNYDVAFVDVMMPKRNGPEVIQEVAAANPDYLKRIVLVTATSESRLKDLGVDPNTLRGYLHKPFDLDHLLAYMR